VSEDRIVWVDIDGIPLSPSLCDDDQIVDSAEERVSETLFVVHPPLDDQKITSKVDVQPSADPFDIYDLLQKPRSDLDKDSSPSLPHPSGGSILGALEDMIRIGLGHKAKKEWVKELNLKHCVNFLSLQEMKLECISQMEIKSIWGNSNFQFASNVLKRTLWSYISELISRCDGEALLLGDFNEVQSADERLGSEFDHSGARSFNHFIYTSGILEIKMEGYFFTWSLSAAAKMSKLDRFFVSEGILSAFPSSTVICLDSHLSDHRPILLKEIRIDFGPSLFQTYHSWFTRDGFDTMVEQAWKITPCNSGSRFLYQTIRLRLIRSWIGVKWAIEGDENSKFFHGLINKKRSQLSIRGVFVDGDWISNPVLIKDAFKEHFASRFKQPASFRLKLNSPFPKRLSFDQVTDLECDISRSEIRKAVWECGENKSPGPDGFSFEFFRRYWNCIGLDFCLTVESFFSSGILPRGRNASFIALIPKVLDAKFVSDFRPISLIGSVYKVITKILENRLAMVISYIVSDTQSAFVAKRSILDGPFILNEILAWCKRKKKQALIFKVDFAKAYDSVRWDYLLDVLLSFGLVLIGVNGFERQNKRRTPNVVEPELRTIVEMADNHTMEELLQAPTEG
nr:RNA-directed DNA polymerase, eukaryota [Tanacetum cinerariifolium]